MIGKGVAFAGIQIAKAEFTGYVPDEGIYHIFAIHLRAKDKDFKYQVSRDRKGHFSILVAEDPEEARLREIRKAAAEYLHIADSDLLKVRFVEGGTCLGIGCARWQGLLDVTARVDGVERHYAGKVRGPIFGGIWGYYRGT